MKASLGVALIARNAEKTIGACLDSIVPFVEQVVVCVDSTTTDDTAKVAAEHGAEVHEGHVVSEPHECPYHGKILAQHFAASRQKSFEYLRKDLEWHMWLDADDVVQGADKIAEMLSRLGPEVAGVWLPYHYARVGDNGPTTTLFDRERIVRSSLPWQWAYRVHEILTPVGRKTEELGWSRTDDVRIVHQHVGHDTAGSAKRNITLLEIDLEEDEHDSRAWFYLGNQYFALGDWQSAAVNYERSVEGSNPYQLWQALVYLSMSYEKMEDLDKSWSAAWRALAIQPSHADPYYRLASICMLNNDWEKCEFWTKMGDRMPDPPFFVFRNPMDKPYNARLTLATAYANAGMTSKARRELEIAAKTVQSKEILDGIAYHRQIEEDTLTAEAYLRVLAVNHEDDITREHPIVIPDSVWKFGRVRDVIVPSMLNRRAQSTQPRIIFFCGRAAEPWSPASINTTGIGGSETAVVQIAKRFAAAGWRVDVYNEPDYLEGEYDGVGYWGLNRLRMDDKCDVLVSWRNPSAYTLPIERRLSILWCHDLNQGQGVSDSMLKWDKVLGVSQWHADYMAKQYGLANTDFVPNGIELERFQTKGPKAAFRCVYASSPDRGLDQLLDMWPRIHAQEPSSELHIAYGWDTIDKYIAAGNQNLAQFKQHMMRKIERTPGVKWLGRLPQDKLAELYSSAYVLLYPTAFLEVSCIVVMEAMAAGCAVVTSGAGALPETIGSGGLVVTGNVYTKSWRDYFTHIARGVLHAPQIRKKYVDVGIERSKELTWDKAFEKWQEIVSVVPEKAVEAVA